MALGILFISFTPGYPPNMSAYLFGDILTVSDSDLIMIASITTIVVITIISLYNYWKSYLFDEEFLEVLGINTVFLKYLLFILIALTIVVLIRVVGIILIIALLTAPAAIARLYTYKLKKMMFFSVINSIVFSFAGLIISYQFNIASGASIILLSSITYLTVVVFKKVV
jgi:zinc transport system permease protein